MTANETAHLMILFDSGRIYEHSQEIATMLRQQAQEIEALEKELALQKLSDIGQEIENEPVAWMFRGYLYDTDPSDWAVHEHPDVPVIPLYTHPNEDRDSAIYATGYWKGIEYKRMRELTDEEVSEFIHQMVLCCQVHPNSADINVLGLAQIVEDILKKASEK